MVVAEVASIWDWMDLKGLWDTGEETLGGSWLHVWSGDVGGRAQDRVGEGQGPPWGGGG